MEHGVSWYLQHGHVSVLVFFLITIISLLRTLIYYTLKRVSCSCDICHTYVNSSWSMQFDNLCDWYTHLLKNSPTNTIHIHVLGNTITSNPENVEYMLRKRFNNYPKGKPFSTVLGDFLGRGIFNVDGEAWRFQRKMACLELGRLSMRTYTFDVVCHEVDQRLIPLLSSFSGKQQGVLDLQDVFRRFSFDTICKFSFGLDPKCLELSLPISEFELCFDLASKLSAQRAMTPSPLVWKIKRMLNIGSEKKLRESIKVVNMFAQEVIGQRKKLASSNHQDLLSRFMATTKDDNYLRDIVINFLLAGRDTVASALTGLFWLLAHHPQVVAAIRDEVERSIRANEKLKSFEQIQELHYLQAVLYEGMRLFPPIQFDSKFCLKDDTFPDGTFVTKGTRVTYHPYAMGRMESIWGKDCLEFKPERWLNDGVCLQENPFKYPVFQAGRRACLGKELALLEMKSVVLSIVRQFNIKLATTDLPPQFSQGLTATFRGGLLVLVSERGATT